MVSYFQLSNFIFLW